MQKNTSNKGIIIQGIGKALTKNVTIAPNEYMQIFQSKRLPRSAHMDALSYLLQLYKQELEKDKYSVVKIQKILYFTYISFVEYVQEPAISIELFSDMKKIRMLYDEFKEKNEKFKNEHIDDVVNEIDELVVAIGPKFENDDISLAQQMKEKLDSAKKELDEKDKEIQRLRDEFDNYTKTLKKDNSYKEKYETSKKEINSLNEEIKKVEKNYKKELNQKEDEINTLNETINILSNEKKDLEVKLTIKESKEKRDERILEILFDIFSSNPLSPNAIIKELENKGYYVSLENLHKYIKQLKLDIVKQAYNNNQFSYGFNKNIDTNREVNLGISFNLNCIFISQLNLDINSIDTYKMLENIYTYCIKNNINYIITLGNIINLNDKDIKYGTIKKLDQVINEIIKNYPQDSSINNFVLGGDNEILLNNHGYNIANILDRDRYDFYNLGNRSASLKINNGKIFVNLHSISEINTNFFVNNFYNTKGFDNPYYLDIVGIDNVSSVNMTNRIITIPPLMSTNKGCSIFQVEISMQDGDFKKFTISPIMNTDFIPTSKLLLYK